MENIIVKAPCIEMKELENLFIELTANNCNLNCPHCYLTSKNKKLKDYLPFEKIRQALLTIDRKKLKFIHLTGAEPMLHPEFNHILRLCLKCASVVIHTNAYSINDKKSRFLRKVEEENAFGHEIVFMLSLDSYIEKENDMHRARGSFRKVLCAIQSLLKYDFSPVISIVNHNNIQEDILKNGFKELFSSIGFETTDFNFKLLPLISKDKEVLLPSETNYDFLMTECSKSRTLTINGVFFCPLLSNDNRGKSGTDFSDYSKKCYLETSYCAQCIASNRFMFSLDFD